MPHVAEPPAVVMVVGVNGSGKTTTIGKLASRYKSEGGACCCAPPIRSAPPPSSSLQVWGARTSTEVIRQTAGADPSAVLFDALQAAKARKVDYVIVDTAGRLQTKTNLMAELEKMRRTAAKVIPAAPHEVLLVLDATTGQNGLEQARRFTESSGVTGIVLTKLDGTAKGGIVVAIARELNLPIRYVGVGEQAGRPAAVRTRTNSSRRSSRHEDARSWTKRWSWRARGWGAPARIPRWARCWCTEAKSSAAAFTPTPG